MTDLFEWDDKKRHANIIEHGVDFADAAQIFLGPVVERFDGRGSYGETRLRALGQVGDDCFLVAYTWRGDRRRIITAWKVGDHGRRRYQALLGR